MRFLKRLVIGLIATLSFAGLLAAFSGQGAAIAGGVIGAVVSVLVAVQRVEGEAGGSLDDSGADSASSDSSSTSSDGGGGDGGGGD